jgi:protein ImuA
VNLSLPLPAPQALEDLHPALWRAHQLGRGVSGVTASGFAVLDAELPGGGWPHRVLTELLLPHHGVGEMRLLAPALATLARPERAQGAAEAGGRCLMLFDPPAALCAGALAQLGVDVRQLLVVRGRDLRGRPPGAVLRRLLPGADVLWALEQALKSGHLGAVLAWLPAPLKADALRRLQMAAQAHDGPAFVLRDIEARGRPSAAPLRLALQADGVDGLQLRLLKRRGPPLAQPLHLSLPAVLTVRQRERALPGRCPHEPVLPARAVSAQPD